MARTTGIKLVIFQFDAAAKRRLQRFDIGAGDGSPAHGIEEGVEALRRVEAVRRGQRVPFDHAHARLDLPDDLQLFSQRVIFHRTERDEVLLPRVPDSPAGAIQPERLRRYRSLHDIRHDIAPLPHIHQLPRLWNSQNKTHKTRSPC